MTKFDYLDLWKEIPVARGDYEEESIRTAPLHGRWLGYYLTEIKKLQKLHQKRKTVVQERTQFYLGKTDVPHPVLVLKSELPRYLDADPLVQEIDDELTEQEAVLKVINDGLTRINLRGHEINAAIKWRKFVHGQND